jgi:hypothetical protein
VVPGGLGGLGGPRPLLLDAAGREVDEAGNVITHAARAPITTSLVSDANEQSHLSVSLSSTKFGHLEA